jgi:hypothetical protein
MSQGSSAHRQELLAAGRSYDGHAMLWRCVLDPWLAVLNSPLDQS